MDRLFYPLLRKVEQNTTFEKSGAKSSAKSSAKS
jgi:hypothetical protein